MKNLAQPIKHLSFKCVIFISLILCHAAIVFANTPVSGNITTDTTWNLEGSPYIITGNIIVYNRNTATLTIEPGVEVRFEPGTQLQIAYSSYYPGALVAQGTETQPIRFTSNAANPSPGDWNGISFVSGTNGDLTVLEHCIVEYGGANTYGNLYFSSSSGTVRNCIIKNSSTDGIHLGGNASPEIDSCSISNNTGNGIHVDDTAQASIKNNTISDNQAYPIYLHPNSLSTIKNTTGSGNGNNGIGVMGGIISREVVWEELGFPYIIIENITVYRRHSATFTIKPGVEVRFEPGTQLQIAYSSYYPGALVAQGTETQPIRFTSNAANPSPGDWNGISFVSGTNGDLTVLEHCIVEYGGANTYGNLYFSSSSGTVRNCIIKNSSTDGIHLGGNASPEIDSCSISNNTGNGIYSGDSAQVSITNNTLTDNQAYPLNLHPGYAGTI